MIRHVVIFEVSPHHASELDHLLELLNGLPDLIEEVRGFSAGRSRDDSLSASLVADFDDLEMLDRYRNHRDHQEALELLRRVSTNVYVSDHETDSSSIPHGRN